ncbi:MAG: GntR family transcriptional regulator [Anaerolineales bacterium]
MLDRSSPVPLYYQLSEILMARIAAGDFKPGDLIPTERELMEMYAVSRITVRAAVDELVKRGFVRREQGRGTFVASPRVQRGGPTLTSFTEDIVSRGFKPGSRLLALKHEPATGRIASELRVPEGTLVWFVERLRLADDAPIALNLSYLNLPPYITLTQAELESEVSLWNLLRSKGIRMAQADKSIEAIPADEWEASLLGVRKNAPLLLIEGVVWDANGGAVEFHRIIARADRYKYYVHAERLE